MLKLIFKILKTFVLTKTFIGIFIALFIKVEINGHWSLIDEWINKILYTHTMEYYLTVM